MVCVLAERLLDRVANHPKRDKSGCRPSGHRRRLTEYEQRHADDTAAKQFAHDARTGMEGGHHRSDATAARKAVS
jgi:hypothetical protein